MSLWQPAPRSELAQSFYAQAAASPRFSAISAHFDPRRINTLCDRLLLLGFMQGKVHLELGDVNEVLKDLANEAELPAPSRPLPLGQGEGTGESGHGVGSPQSA